MAQRSVKHPDVLIAAAAERAGFTLVHYDADYDTIAEITGQPVRWVAPRGSL
jgi:predicted nucleic acid-binding protein